jgi:hypothetical protein
MHSDEYKLILVSFFSDDLLGRLAGLGNFGQLGYLGRRGTLMFYCVSQFTKWLTKKAQEPTM